MSNGLLRLRAIVVWRRVVIYVYVKSHSYLGTGTSLSNGLAAENGKWARGRRGRRAWCHGGISKANGFVTVPLKEIKRVTFS